MRRQWERGAIRAGSAALLERTGTTPIPSAPVGSHHDRRVISVGPAVGKANMGLLALWDAAFSRVRANERLHLAWCCGGVIGCLVR